MLYPMEVLKNQYITILDIEPSVVKDGQAGLNEDVLRHINLLPYQDRVFILSFDHPNRPIFFQHMFQIVPLEGVAEGGEVIVSESDFESGQIVILNNVLRLLS